MAGKSCSPLNQSDIWRPGTHDPPQGGWPKQPCHVRQVLLQRKTLVPFGAGHEYKLHALKKWACNSMLCDRQRQTRAESQNGLSAILGLALILRAEKPRGNSYGSFQKPHWQTKKTIAICKQIYLGSVWFFTIQCWDDSSIIFLPIILNSQKH